MSEKVLQRQNWTMILSADRIGTPVCVCDELLDTWDCGHQSQTEFVGV